MCARKKEPLTPNLPGPPDEVTACLRREARRLTGARRAVLARLQAARHPLSCQEIHLSLEGLRCNLATVYRVLRLLEQLKLVQRFDLGDGVARYELCRSGGPEHHHHLICRRCSRIIELDECDLAAFERRVARRSGFSSVSHRLELFGVCPQCQAPTDSSPSI